MNELLETILSNLRVDNKAIPYGWIYFDGEADTYITYQSTGTDELISYDDEVRGIIENIDIDIYSKSNYLKIKKELIKKMIENDFIYVSESADNYERDTGYYHKTIEFSKERMGF